MTDVNAHSMSKALSPVCLSLTQVYLPYCRVLVLCIMWFTAALSFVEGESGHACFNAADVPDENAAESLTFRNEIASSTYVWETLIFIYRWGCASSHFIKACYIWFWFFGLDQWFSNFFCHAPVQTPKKSNVPTPPQQKRI